MTSRFDLTTEVDAMPRAESILPMEFRCLDDDLLAAPTPWEVSFDDEPTEASPVEGVVMDPEPEPSLMRHQAKELELELRHEIAVERAGVMKMLAEFSEERRQYFCGAEEEVVRLSLAIAERILSREIDVDPTVLFGAVKLALASVADRSGAVLRVSAEEAEAWAREMKTEDPVAELVSDDRLGRGECVLETRLGKIDLSIRTQLKEVENGFLQLIGRRPSLAFS